MDSLVMWEEVKVRSKEIERRPATCHGGWPQALNAVSGDQKALDLFSWKSDNKGLKLPGGCGDRLSCYVGGSEGKIQRNWTKTNHSSWWLATSSQCCKWWPESFWIYSTGNLTTKVSSYQEEVEMDSLVMWEEVKGKIQRNWTKTSHSSWWLPQALNAVSGDQKALDLFSWKSDNKGLKLPGGCGDGLSCCVGGSEGKIQRKLKVRAMHMYKGEMLNAPLMIRTSA